LTPLPPITPPPGTLTSLSEWLEATPFTRKLALPACLERIRAQDEQLHAWVQVSPQAPGGDGPLFGVPVGVKDIFETAGLATEYGSDIYKGRVGMRDAAIVRELKQRGAIVVGKTHTAAFAYRSPAPTRNPHDLAHTPGGSSSGSAAAVAAGMVPLALGTQTKGSVLRPASYCGITGFKPTFGLISTDGVLPFSTSLDTVGFFTHTPADMRAFWRAYTGSHGARVRGCDDAMVLGCVRAEVEPAMAAAFEAAIETLIAAGIPVRTLDLERSLASVAEAAEIVMFYEAAQAHGERYDQYGDRLADVADAVRKGRAIPPDEYADALLRLESHRRQIAAVFDTTPIVASPAATGPAPEGLASTGDPGMNAPWTALGTPAIAVPMPVRGGLPLGLQLIAARGADGPLLDAACRIHDVLHGMLRT
jgi:Asp-tRNA(Asn)/Glu-tRNA(Gln) amidotransferase A subunit family amidase